MTGFSESNPIQPLNFSRVAWRLLPGDSSFKTCAESTLRAYTPDTVSMNLSPIGDVGKIPHYAAIFSVAFFPNGDTLAAGGTDKSVTLWHVNAEKEVLRARDD